MLPMLPPLEAVIPTLIALLLWDQLRRLRSGQRLALAGRPDLEDREAEDLEQRHTRQPLPKQQERAEGTWVAKGGSEAPKPDPNIGKAALKNAELGEDFLAFTKDRMKIADERQADLDVIGKRIGEQQIELADRGMEWSLADRNRWETVFRPLQDRYIKEAGEWDSEANLEKAAGEAGAGVKLAAQGQRDASRRAMMAYGVRPDSGRFAATEASYDLGTALGQAGAENQARDQRRNQGIALRADAMNVGSGLPSQAAGGAVLGMNAGNSAFGNQAAANSAYVANTGIVGQGYGAAMTGYGNQASILNQQYSNQLRAWEVQQQASAQGMAGIGSMIGTAVGVGAAFMSSRKLKTGKRPAPSDALEKVKKLPIERWRYKVGVEDGGAAEHTGTYAEDFRRVTGSGDGNVIPMVDAMGLTMKAVQELDAKVDELRRIIPTKRAA